jgi:hypothetical protein
MAGSTIHAQDIWGEWEGAGKAGHTCSPTARYSADGGLCLIGRPASAPQLHRTRTLPSPQSTGKRAAPTAAPGAQPPRKAVAHSAPLTETRSDPASRSSATPNVLPDSNHPAATGTKASIGMSLPPTGGIGSSVSSSKPLSRYWHSHAGHRQEGLKWVRQEIAGGL